MPGNLLQEYLSGANWVDAAFAAIALYFVVTNKGFVPTLLDLLGFLSSLLFSLWSYNTVADTLASYFALSKGISKAIGFFLAWVFSESLFFGISHLLAKKLPRVSKNVSFIAGSVPAVLQVILLYTFILSLVLTLPTRGSIKKDVLSSQVGPPLLRVSQNLEAHLRPVFNDAILESLHFLTIRPQSTETVNLGFTTVESELKVDAIAEIEMFNLVNNARRERDLEPLTFDDELRQVARDYAVEMFVHGFFSHTSVVDGSSPAQRLERVGISFLVTGENLAYAPDVEFAHTGLMNSPGHRANILSPEFSRVGIGVADAGPFNKIFVQEFRD